uniref:GOLD domain-containing protein n=1 Tax=Caenorhabditis japonica TaxID=281687 RepID=A0A8R1DMI4_CAEJA
MTPSLLREIVGRDHARLCCKDANPAISPASLWNRQDINEFKQNIKKDGSEGIIKVGHGETVTVRVPTHENGSCLFWEFATDHYDIGFGVYFEWTVADSNQVSVHVSESDDEEDYDEAAEAEGAPATGGPGDVESGGRIQTRRDDPNKPRQDEIIPVYRRDCHEEVYAGSHRYPGRGVYLLKFDNSYSLWRSKTLYYRVYYSK